MTKLKIIFSGYRAPFTIIPFIYTDGKNIAIWWLWWDLAIGYEREYRSFNN